MSNVIPFPARMPFSALPEKYVQQIAEKSASQKPNDVLIMETVDDCARVVAGGVELWFSMEEMSDMILQWAQKLSEHARELAEEAER